jgi:hypothetical protein
MAVLTIFRSNTHAPQGLCDGIQLLKLYNKLTSRSVANGINGTGKELRE